MSKIVIIGGGIAGLTSSILLARKGLDVTLIEKKQYPFHRVCGEYVSNEALPFLKSIDIDIAELHPSSITKLSVSSALGKVFHAPLGLGGFGISRYAFDALLYKKAIAEGVDFIIGEKATDVLFHDNQFRIALSGNRELNAGLVICAHGKRSNLDQKLNRSFFYERSPYMGVKYHIRTDFPSDLIQLDNFEGGYCGIVKIEGDKHCLCYLAKNKLLKKYGSIPELEKQILYKNPLLKKHFTNSDFLFEKPEVINEISFRQKPLVENHILFCGDAAGMITPLCGNGMAIALRSAKILTEIIVQNPNFSNYDARHSIEKLWASSWNHEFSFRLKSGRLIQRLFSNLKVSEAAVSLLKHSPGLVDTLIKKTHGKPF